jgi:hypothetical protein
LKTRIVFDNDLRGVVLATDGQFQVVSAGFEWQTLGEDVTEAATATAATATTAAAATSSTLTATTEASGTRRWIAAQVPLDSVESGVISSHDVSHDFPGVIKDCELHIA